MLPYPKELRVRVVATVEQGEYSIPEVASIFSVGITFVKKMLRLHRAGAELAPLQGGGAKLLIKEKEQAFLRHEIESHADATLAELQTKLAEQCGVAASLPTISRALEQLKLPRKKKS